MKRALELVTRSEAETTAVGRRLSGHLAPGAVLALYGDLGTGKTVLTKGIAAGLGVVDPVTSPTFTIVQEYALGHGHWLIHVDLYRITGVEAALDFGIEEYLFAPDTITVLEWPERIEPLLAVPDMTAGQAQTAAARLWRIRLEHQDADGRRLTLSGAATATLSATHEGPQPACKGAGK